MSKLDPKKLNVTFREGVTTTEPIIPRRYTLTHSDITADLHLDIGPDYAYDKVTFMKDEVRGEWIESDGGHLYYVYLDIDGQSGWGMIGIRNFIFRRELPLALEAIRFGDREFFETHPELNYVPIIVFFQSKNPKYQSMENWGNFNNYDLTKAPNMRQLKAMNNNILLLDTKYGDVNGDGILEKVSLYGSRDENLESVYITNITIVIEDGKTGDIKTITPKTNSGYNPTIFLGDFTKNGVDAIKLSMDTGGSGGYGNFFVYTLINNNFNEIFDSDQYNIDYLFNVEYENGYKVAICNEQLDKCFQLDISNKSMDYLSQYYNEEGDLITPIQGEVQAISALIPFVSNEMNAYYELSAVQRVVGTFNADTLGYIQNLLAWNGDRFESMQILVSVQGTNFATEE